jgi:hypothetical protein
MTLNAEVTVGDRELAIARVYDAPRAVFNAWSKPEHLKRWFAPNNFTIPVCEMTSATTAISLLYARPRQRTLGERRLSRDRQVGADRLRARWNMRATPFSRR